MFRRRTAKVSIFGLIAEPVDLGPTQAGEGADLAHLDKAVRICGEIAFLLGPELFGLLGHFDVLHNTPAGARGTP